MTSRLHRRFGPWLGHHAFEFKWYYLGAFLCLVVLQNLQAEIPERIRRLTEALSASELSKSSVWVFVGLAIGIFIFRTLSRLLFFYPARVQQKTLRMELLNFLESVPPPRYGSRNQGQIFQILFDDINSLRGFVGFGMLQICNILIAFFVLIPRFNETESYLWPAFTPLFASVFLFSLTSLINQKLFKKMMDKKGEVQNFIIESYEAKQTIKNFHREDSFIQGFVRASSEELNLFFKSSVAFAFTTPYTRLGLGFSLLWGAVLIRNHGGSTSDLVFFSGFLYLFLEPVMFLSWVAVVMAQGFAAWRRVKELYNELKTVPELEQKLSSVRINFEEDKLALSLDYWEKEISLKLPLHRWTVLVGETGSGKSRLLSNMTTAMNLQKKSVSMVQQEPYLFNDTVEENIFLGKAVSEVELARAKKLLRMFQLESIAPSEDEILKLEVGENGKRLSGGQMKRVALVRSLLSGADVLIWDDPFSSVDIILERKIIHALKSDPETRTKTFIISSHRLTTVRLSDEVIYLDKEHGIRSQGAAHEILRDQHVSKFFQEQLVDIPLA